MPNAAELRAQRAQLRERIAHERAQFHDAWQPVVQAMDVRSRVDGLLGQMRGFAERNPLAVAGAVVALVIFKPRMLLRVAQQGLLLWRTWRSVRGLLPASLLSMVRGFLR